MRYMKIMNAKLFAASLPQGAFAAKQVLENESIIKRT